MVNYSEFEKKLIKNENISFVKLLIEREIKNYKYNIKEENIINYLNKFENKNLYSEIKNYDITDNDLIDIRESIINTSKYNLEVEYLPTEDWELPDVVNQKKELVLTIPSYDMISSGLALFILILPFCALFASYFLIMVFR